MSLIDALRHRLRALVRPDTHARDLDEELRFHLALDAMQRRHAAGAADDSLDAHYAALRKLGNITYVKEETRQMAGLGFFDMALQDARFAFRTFSRSPGFTIVAVLTLGIGIGANTAIFSAVDAMLIRPLPFTDPSRLMQVSLTVPGQSISGRPGADDMIWSYPKFAVFRDQQHVFSDVALYADQQVTVTGVGDAERDHSEMVGARYLRTLGVPPVLGRDFSSDEDAQPDGPRVVLLGNALWSRRFNADSSVIGRTLDIGGDPYTIIGVLPAGFNGLTGLAELWTPILAQSAAEINEPWMHSYWMVARLAPGVSEAQAVAASRQLGANVDAAYPLPREHEHWGATARALDARRVDPLVRRSLIILLAAVGLVLLIACANVANLFLVRATGRSKEIAVRLALGAGRRRLVRQLLTESLLLSALGGVASVAIAWWGVRMLSVLNPANALGVQHLRGLGAVDFASIHLDVPAFAVAATLAVVTGLVFGLVPAIQMTRPSLTVGLKDEGGRAPAARFRWLSSRNVLAVAEVALSLVLLAGSGLMVRSLAKLIEVDPGFDAKGVLTMRMNAPGTFTADSLPGFYDRMLNRLSSLPGASGAALIDCPPLNGGCNGTIIEFHDRPPAEPGTEPNVGVHWVTPNWFSVMHVPLVAGRLFTSDDRVGRRKVVLINAAAAKKFWPGADPIGHPVMIGQGGMDTAYVVGVVGDVRFGTIDSVARPDAYISYYQSPRGRMMLFVRSAGDPLALTGMARQALHELAAAMPVYDVESMTTRVGDAMSYARFSALLLSLFAIMALGLATMGTYGVMSFAVAQRAKEIGIRVALGATRGDVMRLVVGQGVLIAVVGTVAGLAGAFAATRVLKSLLFDVAPSDPVTFVAIVAVLAASVIAASWVPARRAALIDPIEALRRSS